MATCHILRLDRISYQAALALQLRLVERLKATQATDGALLVLEHDPVITIGRSGGAEHLRVAVEELARRGIALHETGRGGDITYHGPGQVVGYPVLRLTQERRDVHRYLRSLEAVIIRALGQFGIEGRREPGYTGVWVGDAKVAAVGVALTRWIAYHGFALNVATELDAFGLIVPCGLHDRPVTSMEKFLGGKTPARAAVEDALVEEFVGEFGFGAARECSTAEELAGALR